MFYKKFVSIKQNIIKYCKILSFTKQKFNNKMIFNRFISSKLDIYFVNKFV